MRKAAESLKEEYCKIINSVTSEKQRNLMYIEKAKRGFIEEMNEMNLKVDKIDLVKGSFSRLEEKYMMDLQAFEFQSENRF